MAGIVAPRALVTPKLSVPKASAVIASTPLLLPRVDLGLQLSPVLTSQPPNAPISPAFATSTAIVGKPPTAGVATTTPTGYPNCNPPIEVVMTLDPAKVEAWKAANCKGVPQQTAPVGAPLAIVGASAIRPIATPPTLNIMGGRRPTATPVRVTMPPKAVPSYAYPPATPPTNADVSAYTTTSPIVVPPVFDAAPAIVPVGIPTVDNTMPTGSAVYAGNGVSPDLSLAVSPGVPVIATSGGEDVFAASAPSTPSTEEGSKIPTWAIAAGAGAVLVGLAVLAKKKRWL